MCNPILCTVFAGTSRFYRRADGSIEEAACDRSSLSEWVRRGAGALILKLRKSLTAPDLTTPSARRSPCSITTTICSSPRSTTARSAIQQNHIPSQSQPNPFPSPSLNPSRSRPCRPASAYSPGEPNVGVSPTGQQPHQSCWTHILNVDEKSREIYAVFLL